MGSVQDSFRFCSGIFQESGIHGWGRVAFFEEPFRNLVFLGVLSVSKGPRSQC